MLQRKDEYRDKEQGRDELEDALGQEIQHGARTARVLGVIEAGGEANAASVASGDKASKLLSLIFVISASIRPRAPVRPASACSLEASWCERSGSCGERCTGSGVRRVRPSSYFHRSPCALLARSQDGRRRAPCRRPRLTRSCSFAALRFSGTHRNFHRDRSARSRPTCTPGIRLPRPA